MCLHDARNLERNTRKLARFRNHLRFSLQGKHTNVTPVSLRLKSNFESFEAKRILARAEKASTNERICLINFTINGIERKIANLHDKLRSELRASLYQEVTSH